MATICACEHVDGCARMGVHTEVGDLCGGDGGDVDGHIESTHDTHITVRKQVLTEAHGREDTHKG
jgi:hypothetical protein